MTAAVDVGLPSLFGFGLIAATLTFAALSWAHWMCWSGRWRRWFHQRWDVPLGTFVFGYLGAWTVSFFLTLWFTGTSTLLLVGSVVHGVVPSSALAERLWMSVGTPLFGIWVLLLFPLLVALWNAHDVHAKVHKRGRFPWSIRLLAPAWFKAEVLRQVRDMPDAHTPPPSRGLPPDHGEQSQPGGAAHAPRPSRVREILPPPSLRNPGSVALPPPPPPEEH